MPSFLCDEMLARLARWLRAAGYDTSMARRGTIDSELVALAAAESRLLLTRDRAILERKAARERVLVLIGTDLDAWAAELSGRAGVDWMHAPFTRCLVCNRPLEPAREGLPVPGGVSADPTDILWCAECGRPYWPGSHVRRMSARLRRWKTGISSSG